MRRVAFVVVLVAAASGACSSDCWQEEELTLGGGFYHYTGGVTSLVRVSDRDADPQVQAVYRVAAALRDVQTEKDPASIELVFRSTADRSGPPPQWLGMTVPLPLTMGERLPIVSGEIPEIWRVGPALAERAVKVGWRVGWETKGPSMGTATGTVEVLRLAPLQLQIQVELAGGAGQPMRFAGPAIFRDDLTTHELCDG